MKLPHEIIIHIYEYNPEHREKMKHVLQDIRDKGNCRCQVCNKIIIKRILTLRNHNSIICCSSECVDNYDFYIYFIEHSNHQFDYTF